MMANYLQRIAIAGARTGSSISPPAQAPVLVPSGVIPVAGSHLEAAAEDAGVARVESASSSGIPLSPGTVSDTTSTIFDEQAVPHPETITPAGSGEPRRGLIIPGPPIISRRVVHAPRGLRREPQPNAGALRTEAALGGPAEFAPDAANQAGQSDTAIDSPLTAAASRAPAAADQLTNVNAPMTTEHHSGASPQADSPSLTKTKSIVVTSRSGDMRIHSEDARSKEQAPAASFLSPGIHASNIAQSSPQKVEHVDNAPGVLPAVHGAQESSAHPMISPVQPIENSSAKARVEPRPVSSGPPVGTIMPSSRTTTEKGRIEVAAAPAATVARLAANGDSRQNRISIGRIDVQVNNQSPQASRARPIPPAGTARGDFLQARYLNRFVMKP